MCEDGAPAQETSEGCRRSCRPSIPAPDRRGGCGIGSIGSGAFRLSFLGASINSAAADRAAAILLEEPKITPWFVRSFVRSECGGHDSWRGEIWQ